MMESPGDQDLENMLGLMGQGFAVTFENGETPGLYYCMLRSTSTGRLVNCVVAETVSGALRAAADWARDGSHPVPEEHPELFRQVTASRLKSLEELVSGLSVRADSDREEAKTWDENTESMFAGILERLGKLEGEWKILEGEWKITADAINSGSRRLGALEETPPQELAQRITGLSERITAVVDRVQHIEDAARQGRHAGQHPYPDERTLAERARTL
jgi:hypothetical protein